MAGIYVHIPFCHSKCAYCDFYSLANTGRMVDFAGALSREWEARRHELGDSVVRTVYFGGGTPSILPPDSFRTIAALFPLESVEEFTIEVNPEDVSPANASVWKSAGVNRVSMGVQSLVDAELRDVGRRHDAAQALNAVECLLASGITNISCDLIYGLPGQTCDSWQTSLDGLLATGISHLSAYCLSYEPGTRLDRMRRQGRVAETDEDTLAQMYAMLCRAARVHGFDHYEISNFGRPGCHSMHNCSYWNGTPYLGLGPGAHSLGADGVRRYVRSDIKAYLSAPSDVLAIDEETHTDRLNDAILTGLRTSAGLDTAALSDKERAALQKNAAAHLRAGNLTADGSCLRVPEDRWLMCDAVIRDLFFD